jgi:hypothetical protein
LGKTEAAANVVLQASARKSAGGARSVHIRSISAAWGRARVEEAVIEGPGDALPIEHRIAVDVGAAYLVRASP